MNHPVRALADALGIKTLEEKGTVIFLVGDTWVDSFPFALFAKKAVDLKSRAEAAEADTARLDWLDEQRQPETFEDAPHAQVWCIVGEPDLRTAIDAARAALAGKEAKP